MFDFFVDFFGIIVTGIFVAYLVLLALLQGKKKELATAKTLVNMANMPVLRPIPIPTANQKTLLNKVLVWVFQVRRWRVEQAFIYKYKGKKYAIHAGFEFDGASIPKPLWGLLSPIGLLLVPGLIHDYGYRYNGIYSLDENNNPLWDETISTQSGWDELFKNIGNEVNKIPALNELAKLGLWLGGFKAWNAWRDTKQDRVPFKWTIDDEKQASHEPQNEPQQDASDDEVVEIKSTSEESVSNDLFVSGATKTTQINYENSNNQKVLGSRNLDNTDKQQVTYKMACGDCGEVYGAKTSEIHRRKCPVCQEGKPSVDW
ncbi:DUF1353 domain-containing protein [Colwellia piezophila]|uniref:DUF1353 domain-containing protein n=1 Tax=Colwellia piezophila TaxID=211668 RepID=UPI00037E055B|nr:DUF1353 domain-containing protein [Colwellia piezophila]